MAPPSKGPPVPDEDPDLAVLPPPPEGEAPADPSLCPRCGGKLTNPDGLGWCPGCGYCRSLAEEEAVVPPPVEPAPPKKPSVLGATEFGEAMRRMPGWAWPLLGGAAAVAGASVAADYCLPEDGLARALWSALQMVLSVVGLVAAQLWAVMLVGAREDGIGARDVILGGRVWRAALRRLPATRKPVWLGAWCLTGLVCGAAVVGGFGYWLELVREKRLRQVAEALSRGESPKAPAKETSREPQVPPPGPAPTPDDRSQVAQCVVIGYQTDGTKVTGLVLATTDGSRLKYAGLVKEGLSPTLAKDLMGRLSHLGRDEPLIPGLKVGNVLWVKPGVFCDVKHAGADKDGHLEQPALKELHD
jgi:hypothetical protein